MIIWQRLSLAFSGLCGCVAVALAALSAHMPDHLLIPNGRTMLSHGIDMLIWHALAIAIFALAGLATQRLDILRFVCLPMALGTILFTTPVVSLALGGPNFAILAPWGGALVMLAWLALVPLAFILSDEAGSRG